jgi:uncharacterized Zn finger protein
MTSCPKCHSGDVASHLARLPDNRDDWVHTCRACGMTFPEAMEVPAPPLADLAAEEPAASERSDER